MGEEGQVCVVVHPSTGIPDPMGHVGIRSGQEGIIIGIGFHVAVVPLGGIVDHHDHVKHLSPFLWWVHRECCRTVPSLQKMIP